MQTASYESAQASSAKTAAVPRGAFSQPPAPPEVEWCEPLVVCVALEPISLPALPQGVFDKRDRA